MKKSFVNRLIVLTIACGFCSVNSAVFGQTDADVAAKFVDAAKASSDSQLGGNSAITGKLNSLLSSLTGGQDSAALASAFKLVSSAKLTPEQLGLAKQVGNLASAYVVQKNFTTLDGSQGDVANIVNSLRSGKIKDAVPSLKNVATSAKLSDTQKQLIATIEDKYAPGLSKASGALEGIHKIPGF
jgi:hypothetical protein